MIFCSAIIVAAGSSRRAGFDKLMADLKGKPVLRRTLEAFASCPEINEIIVVSPAERYESLMAYGELPLPVRRVEGGSERHFSVSAGLNTLSPEAEWVAIHDGARPLIAPRQIKKCLEAARETGAATSAHPIVETLKRADANGYSGESVDRENLWAMETPQIFSRELICHAYEQVLQAGHLVTDEVSALEYCGHKTRLVKNETPNPKITYPEDILLAECLIGTSALEG